MNQRFSKCRFLVQQWLSQTLASPSGSPRPPLLSHLPGPHIPLNDHEHWETSLHPRPTWSSALPAFTIHGLPDRRGWSGFRELCQRVSSWILLWEGTHLEAKSTAGATTWPSSFRKQPAANESGMECKGVCISLEQDCPSPLQCFMVFYPFNISSHNPCHCEGFLPYPNHPSFFASYSYSFIMGLSCALSQ